MPPSATVAACMELNEAYIDQTQAEGAHPANGKSPAQQLAPLYRGTLLFGIACGISLALTPLHLDRENFSKEDIGSLALFFAAGLVLFSMPVGGLIRRFGSKATLTAALAGYALCVGVFPFMKTFATIAAVRFLDGMFSICVWVSSETVVLSRADEKHKAHLTSLYAIWLASGYVTGPLLARLLSPVLSYEQMFLLAGAVAVGSALYVAKRLKEAGSAAAHTTASDEARSDIAAGHEERSIWQLLRLIKTSCFASFSYGYFQAAVVLFLPLYLIESKGIAADDTIILPGLFCFGMLLFSNVAGRFGDRAGHLLVMSALSTIGMLCVFGFVFVDQYWLMCALVFLAGATLASMSPIALALTGVIVQPHEVGRANSLYNTFYASGIFLGPPLSSLFFAHYGGAAMLYHLAVLWIVFVVFAIVFSADDPAWRARRLVVTPEER